MNVYETLPVVDGNKLRLREVRDSDADALLKVYSDKKAAEFFNGDNCHGDDFYYTTRERMAQAVAFWADSYAHGYFVRWLIEDKSDNTVIGTIELFHRDDAEHEQYGNCGLLRADIRSDHESYDVLKELFSLVKNFVYDWFYCDKLVTKIKPSADQRLRAAQDIGFKPISEPLIGNDGEEYFDYYTLRK